MRTTVSKWGNSLALRLPQPIVSGARLSEGQSVELEVREDGLFVRPSRPRYSLDKLLDGFTRSNQQDEAPWGEARGDEVW